VTQLENANLKDTRRSRQKLEDVSQDHLDIQLHGGIKKRCTQCKLYHASQAPGNISKATCFSEGAVSEV